MALCNLDELRIGYIIEKHMFCERQIGAVQLEMQARGHDGFIFHLHPGVAVFDIGGIADLGRLTIADDIHAVGHLPGNGFVNGRRHGRIKGCLIKTRVVLTREDEVDDLLRAR